MNIRTESATKHFTTEPEKVKKIFYNFRAVLQGSFTTGIPGLNCIFQFYIKFLTFKKVFRVSRSDFDRKFT